VPLQLTKACREAVLERDSETRIGGARRSFRTTAWTDILQARDGSTTAVKEALDHLIGLYWKPVYFHVRRQGHGVEDAKDLTQQFFLLFVKRKALQTVDPAKGKFRTFLLAALNHFLCDEYDRRTAKKRRPDFDFAEADKQFHEDNTFERDWAITVLERAFLRLKELAPREARVVEAQRSEKTPYRDLAEELGTTEANVKVLAHRGRKKLRALILEELRGTVSQPGQEEEELAALFRAFSL
jgi:RNA polymerase sigma factor (sigma-70 family)